MCWGFSCGDGWFNLIDVLCDLCTIHLETHPEFSAEFCAVQVKENLRLLEALTKRPIFPAYDGRISLTLALFL